MERIDTVQLKGHLKQEDDIKTRYGAVVMVSIFFINLFIDLKWWPRSTDVRSFERLKF